MRNLERIAVTGLASLGIAFLVSQVVAVGALAAGWPLNLHDLVTVGVGAFAMSILIASCVGWSRQ